jgi:hypothetical protein
VPLYERDVRIIYMYLLVDFIAFDTDTPRTPGPGPVLPNGKRQRRQGPERLVDYTALSRTKAKPSRRTCPSRRTANKTNIYNNMMNMMTKARPRRESQRPADRHDISIMCVCVVCVRACVRVCVCVCV